MVISQKIDNSGVFRIESDRNNMINLIMRLILHVELLII